MDQDPGPSSISLRDISSSASDDGARTNGLSKEEKPTGNTQLCQEVGALWNAFAKLYGLPTAISLTKSRQSRILARSRDLVQTFEFPDPLTGFQELFEKVRGSPFLLGQKGFKCDLDFVTKESSFTKIMEGSYGAL